MLPSLKMITASAPAATALAIFTEKSQVPRWKQRDVSGEAGEVSGLAAGVGSPIGLSGLGSGTTTSTSCTTPSNGQLPE